MSEYHQSEQRTWLSMNAKVKDIRRTVSQFGAKVPGQFSLWNPSGPQNGFTPNGVSQNHLQLIFLSIEEPCSECTLFSTSIPNEEFHGSLPWTKLIDSTGKPFLKKYHPPRELDSVERARSKGVRPIALARGDDD